jgi:hypothetical protein
MTPDEVWRTYFAPQLSVRWVLKRVTPRVELARGVVRYYEADVVAWIETKREQAA